MVLFTSAHLVALAAVAGHFVIGISLNGPKTASTNNANNVNNVNKVNKVVDSTSSCEKVYFQNKAQSSSCLAAHLGNSAPATGVNCDTKEQLPENVYIYRCVKNISDSSYNVKVKDYSGNEFCLYRKKNTSEALFNNCDNANLTSSEYIFYMTIPEKSSHYIIQSADDLSCLSMTKKNNVKSTQFATSGCMEKNPSSDLQWKLY